MSPSAASLAASIGGPFDLIGGLPVHPLIVHLAVIALPAAAWAGYTIYATIVAGHSGAVATWLPRVGG